MVKKNNVFLQALVLTVVVFSIGIFFGMSLEGNRIEKINDYYLESEIKMMDILSFNNLVDTVNVSCEQLTDTNFKLVDKVYFEAKKLEKYMDSNKLNQELDNFNRKYSILRTYLWIDSIKVKEKCEDRFNTIVYLYNGSSKDLTIMAKQNVFSKILEEVKKETGRETLLIPIDVSSDLDSLNSLISTYNPERKNFPIVIVNEKKVFNEIDKKENILSELDNFNIQN